MKPEFFKSRMIESLPLATQRTFIGLWCYCDDYGRGMDDPHLIKADVWPLTDKHTPARVNKDLEELAAKGLIRRYEVGGKRYIQVTNWSEHQKPQHPRDSKFPEMPSVKEQSDDSTPHEDDMTGTEKGSTEQGTGVRGVEQGASASDGILDEDGLRCLFQTEPPDIVSAGIDKLRLRANDGSITSPAAWLEAYIKGEVQNRVAKERTAEPIGLCPHGMSLKAFCDDCDLEKAEIANRHGTSEVPA